MVNNTFWYIMHPITLLFFHGPTVGYLWTIAIGKGCMDAKKDNGRYKLTARALVFDNYIKIVDNGWEFQARPLGWEEKTLLGGLKAQFTLKYLLFKDTKLIGKLRFDDVHDTFVIEKGGKETTLKPAAFEYDGKKYETRNILRGLQIYEVDGPTHVLVARATTGLTSYSISFESYPDELQDIMKEMAALFVIRSMVMFMIPPI